VTIPDPSSSKASLRKLMRQKGTPQDSASVCEELNKWLLTRPSLQTIAAFLPLADEVDLRPCIARYSKIRWVFPRVQGLELRFHEAENLKKGSFGILEPGDETPEIPLAEIDAFLCPGLAFSRDGGRLGRGRGYYDRLLPQIRPGALKIGICFPDQIVADTFSEAHDCFMDEVIF
jgi:5-formyltetrahydrofolate cyclo-ligase